MLLPEARIGELIEQLKALPVGDRKAILARLSPTERALMFRRMRGTGAPRQPASPFSPDLAARIAAVRSGAEVPMTTAGQAALAKALVVVDTPQPDPGARSLIDTLVNRLWPRGGAA